MLAAGVGADAADLRPAPSPSRRRRGRARPPRRDRAVPSRRPARRHRAAGGRELGQRAEPADGARGDRVVGLATVGRRPTPRRARSPPARWRGRRPRSPRSMNSHLRPTDSTRSTRASGSIAARTRPGKPAPEPTSQIARAAASSAKPRPERLSATCTVHACREADGPLGAEASASSISTIGSSAARAASVELRLAPVRARRSGRRGLNRRSAGRRRSGARARRPRCRSRRRCGP